MEYHYHYLSFVIEVKYHLWIAIMNFISTSKKQGGVEATTYIECFVGRLVNLQCVVSDLTDILLYYYYCNYAVITTNLMQTT